MSNITYGSVCSGIEAATIAWHNMGWTPAWLAEIDPAASRLLAERYGATAPVFTDKPVRNAQWGNNVTNWGDMTRIGEMISIGLAVAPDVLCGGTPCQSFSLAGMRRGLADDRGNLTLKFVELANVIDDHRDTPCTIFWENVPGVFSDAGNAFGNFIAALAGDDEPIEPGPRPAPGRSSAHWRWKKETGQHVPKWSKSGVVVGSQRTVAWRTSDAQYFGLAQRRKRVFVVASADYRVDPVQILFEFDGVRRDSPPSRETGQGFTTDLENGTTGFTMGPTGGELTDLAPTLDTRCKDGPIRNQLGVGVMCAIVAPTLNAHFGEKMGLENQHIDGGAGMFVTHALRGEGFDASEDATRYAVRRLMPIECERLQGFPDGYTDTGQTDGPRYKQLGNSWAVPVVRFYGERINAWISRINS